MPISGDGFSRRYSFEILECQASNQIARNNKEDIDTSESAGRQSGTGVEGDDRQYRDGAQSVDVRAMGLGTVRNHADPWTLGVPSQ